jgi:serine/threonine-protein kinase HipA
MNTGKSNILVYIHWTGMEQPRRIGILSVQHGKGRQSYSFEYDNKWINSNEQSILDPDIGWYSGQQFPNRKENFGIFLDSMPDSWGRTLMTRRENLKAREEGRPVRLLKDIDFLLGVNDECRMGALRFKLDETGPYLNNDTKFPIPALAFIRDLQHGIDIIESGEESKEADEILHILIAPGSSLGGARPKSNISDESGQLWIAKFPSKNDIIDKGAWEFLVYRMAVNAGIEMSESKIQQVSGKHHIFLTKRFDRMNDERIHFASAMTMTGNIESAIRDNAPSYLEIAEFIQFSGSNIKTDLHQLWRRIVFNIAVSNTDDHLRNHGFIIKDGAWRLSPAFDVNPSVDKDGLALNIDMVSNSLNFDLAMSVGEYFQLEKDQMSIILGEAKSAVKKWRRIADEIGILKSEQEAMAPAFSLAVR